MNKIKLKSMLESFFLEDIGEGDLSSQALFTQKDRGTFYFMMKEDGIFCGRDIIETGFKIQNDGIQTEVFVQDGDAVTKGQTIASIEGPMADLLQAERVVLNLVQRMSGIATNTHHVTQLVRETGVRICDTRKTTPGLRMLEKYAVRSGGGFNHRQGLYDAVMLKDNHISFAGSITEAVKQVKNVHGHTVKVEVEIETREQMHEAIEAGADIIMFDNRLPQEITEWIQEVPAHIITEASGGITLDTIIDYAKTGVHYISLGYLTHSVKALDISAKVQFDKAALL